MARLTVEDCLDNVDNRFELVLLASKRARKLSMSGEEALVSWDKDKPTVVALREIAEGYIDSSYLYQQDTRPLVEEHMSEEVTINPQEEVISQTKSESDSNDDVV